MTDGAVPRGSAGRGTRLGRSRIGEVVRFATTGSVAYLSDLVVFNALLLGPGVDPGWAKLVSSTVAIAVAFAGSRWFTWRDRRSHDITREYVLFVVFSVLGAGIQYSCLMVSHHLVGWTSPLADNLSANMVGMALATVFRFWAFRTLVFRPPPVRRPTPPAEPPH